MRSACTQCGEKFGWNKPTMVAWIGKEHFVFCSSKCRQEFLYPKRTNRFCVREVCNNTVPKVNRMLCLHCYQRGDNLAESDLCFTERDNAHWQQKKNELINRIEGKVRIYSAQDMTQEELLSLVPSLQEEAA